MSDLEAEVVRDMDHSAASVWAVVADFGDLSWAGDPQTEVIGNGPGMMRRLTIPGLPEPIEEVMDAIDHEGRVLNYSIPRGLPLPIGNYRASARIEELGAAACRVRWRGMATPQGVSAEQASAILQGTYAQLLDWLAARMQKA